MFVTGTIAGFLIGFVTAWTLALLVWESSFIKHTLWGYFAAFMAEYNKKGQVRVK